MDETRFFVDLGILFLAALGGAAVAQLLRQPLIVGYVLAGIVVGPFTPGPTIADSHFVSLFAEVGVILLAKVGMDHGIVTRPVYDAILGTSLVTILMNALTFRHYRLPA